MVQSTGLDSKEAALKDLERRYIDARSLYREVWNGACQAFDMRRKRGVGCNLSQEAYNIATRSAREKFMELMTEAKHAGCRFDEATRRLVPREPHESGSVENT